MIQRLVLPVLFASLAATASAADGIVASGSASVTGLSYHLIDLDPTDGIAPSITFTGSYVGVGSVTSTWSDSPWSFVPVGDSVHTPGDLFSSAPASYASSSGNVTGGYSSNSAAINTSLSMTDFNALASAGSEGGYGVILTAASGMFFGRDDHPDYPGVWVPLNPGQSAFTLSANTALVIDGQWHVNANLDLSQVTPGVFLNAFVTNHVSAGVALQLDDGKDGVFAYNSIGLQQSLDGNGPGELVIDRMSDAPDSPFSVQINNTSASSVNGALVLGAEADYNVRVSVPEPGTWALMGLGLVATGLVSGRSTRRKQRA